VKVGIIGLPNAGKSSLFNALTRAGAEAANYPFTTVEPNVAVVPVPDERLDAVVATVKATPTVYETIEFHDIAGLVRGAHKGEGLGNQFLANIRETDALVHVVRAHDDDQVVHPEGRVDPIADIETIETELLYADLEQAERRLDKVRKEAKAGEREKVAERDWLEALVAALQEGRTARTVPVPDDAPDALRNLQPLTAKPVLYLANIAEGEAAEAPAAIAEHAAKTDARAVAVSARLESELGELDDGEAAAMRADLGVEESGLATVVRGAWDLLGLISFFTAGEGKEGRAWAVRRGTAARSAAGKIHTDIEKGFVAAEVVAWKDLVDVGGYTAAREQAKLRVEGREYEVQDGDVMTVRFTP
jgi:GTP-binding protein YchF